MSCEMGPKSWLIAPDDDTARGMLAQSDKEMARANNVRQTCVFYFAVPIRTPTSDMKKLLITTALCASILPANADQQTANAYAELVCDKMGTKVMDQFVISAEQLADANAARKDFAESCKKLWRLFGDGVITNNMLETAQGDLLKGYIKTFDEAFPRQRTSILPKRK